MDEHTWQDLYRNLEPPRLARTLVGFNVNLDRIIPVTQGLLASLPPVKGELARFRDRLNRSMQTCTADELFVRDTVQYRQFIRHFSGASVIGGQAGIAAVHLARAGVPEVICIAPSLGATTRGMLREAGVTIPGPAPVPAEQPDTVHLVFEYAPGLVPLAPGAVPRNNRFIVSPLHDPSATLPAGDLLRRFLDAAASCDRAFLSGYQYLISGREFSIAAGQLAEAKKLNPDLKIHAEWVAVEDREIAGRFIRYILPHADSLGLNEQELGFLYRCMNREASPEQEKTPPSAEVLARQAIEICRATGLARLHLHTFGYYIAVGKGAHHQEKARDALLHSARTAAEAAGGTGAGIVREGWQALDDAAVAFGTGSDPGIFRSGEYRIIIVPSLVAQGITKTAGLGDRISSLAFAADSF
jgi:ADP-dependent phosphofructokinase/glucokinase